MEPEVSITSTMSALEPTVILSAGIVTESVISYSFLSTYLAVLLTVTPS